MYDKEREEEVAVTAIEKADDKPERAEETIEEVDVRPEPQEGVTVTLVKEVGDETIEEEIVVTSLEEIGDVHDQVEFIYEEPNVAKRVETRTDFRKYLTNGTISAAVMVFAAILAVVVANTPAYEIVEQILETNIGFAVGDMVFGMSIESFVNDFLMAVFFLLVGVELKYEMTVGELRRPRQAALPMLAAVGGVAAPALIFLLFNFGKSTASGWAIPIATDIAFALGVMSLLGDSVEPETKVFFQTLAIADDILAIVVLALFYGQTPDIVWCALTLGALFALFLLHHVRVYSLKPYMFVGAFLWFFMYRSGIHATLAGVLLAFYLPVRSDVRLPVLHQWLDLYAHELEDAYDDHAHILGQHDFTEGSYNIERVMHHVTPPLERVERNISVLVNFVILPLFAFVNAQVRLVGIDPQTIATSPVTLGAYLGAVVGKPIGIILVTWILVKVGFAKLPKHMDWIQVIDVGIMGGLGFTMSILIAGLAFPDPELVLSAKCAILAGSVTSGTLGLIFMKVADLVRGKGSDVDYRDRMQRDREQAA